MKLGRCAIKERKKERKKIKVKLINEGSFNKLFPYLLFCKISSKISISYQLLLIPWGMVLLVSGKISLPGFQTAVFLLCPHMAFPLCAQRERDLCYLLLSYKDTRPIYWIRAPLV